MIRSTLGIATMLAFIICFLLIYSGTIPELTLFQFLLAIIAIWVIIWIVCGLLFWVAYEIIKSIFSNR